MLLVKIILLCYIIAYSNAEQGQNRDSQHGDKTVRPGKKHSRAKPRPGTMKKLVKEIENGGKANGSIDQKPLENSGQPGKNKQEIAGRSGGIGSSLMNIQGHQKFQPNILGGGDTNKVNNNNNNQNFGRHEQPVGGSLGGSLGNSQGGSLGGPLGNSQGGSFGSSLGNSQGGSFGGSLGNSQGGSLGGPLDNSQGGSFEGSLGNSQGGSFGGSLGNSQGSSFGGSLGNSQGGSPGVSLLGISHTSADPNSLRNPIGTPPNGMSLLWAGDKNKYDNFGQQDFNTDFSRPSKLPFPGGSSKDNNDFGRQRGEQVLPDGCNVDGRFLKVGDKWSVSGICGVFTCQGNMFRTVTTDCPPLKYQEGSSCDVQDQDMMADFPNCCPKLVCSNKNENPQIPINSADSLLSQSPYKFSI